MTQFERIKAMTVEEMADAIFSICLTPCDFCTKKENKDFCICSVPAGTGAKMISEWLESEV